MHSTGEQEYGQTKGVAEKNKREDAEQQMARVGKKDKEQVFGKTLAKVPCALGT